MNATSEAHRPARPRTPQLDPRPRHDRDARQARRHQRQRTDRRLRGHRRRCGLTSFLSVNALGLIWSIDVGTADLPGLADPGAMAGDGLVDLFAAGARVVASVMLAYLALASVANLVSSFEWPRRRAPRLVRWFDCVAPRWLVMASVGIVASSALSAPVGAAEPVPSHDDVLMELVEDGRARPSAVADAEPATKLDRSPRTMLPWADIIDAPPATLPPPPRLEPVESGPIPNDTSGGSGPQPSLPQLEPGQLPHLEPGQLPPPAHVERPLPAAQGRLHTVQPGEHFWGIAERTVAEGDLEIGVTEYWQRLIDLNRAGLVDPDNPDLIFSGQVLILP